MGCYDLLKFCRDIIVAHQTGAFGGKEAFWKFMKDVASNLNKKKQDYRFSHDQNSICFGQALKVYGRQHMSDLHSLNYMGPSISTTKRENCKGVRFIPGKHAGLFKVVARVVMRTDKGEDKDDGSSGVRDFNAL
jgi:hypothetical protein